MKIYKNALSEDVLISVRAEVQSKFYESCWSNTQTNPSLELRKFITGPTLTTSVSEDITEAILGDISDLLPECDELSLNFEAICPASGRSKFVDATLAFTGFLSLNEVWNPSAGGIFMWWPSDAMWDENSKEPSNEDPVKAITPVYNNLILNDEKEWYLVTPVAVTSPCPLIGVKVEGKFTRDESN